jgi:predicted dehydrogenase
MMDGLRIAIVGCGQVAHLHTLISASDGHRLDWVIGRVPERAAAFAELYGFARHGVDLHHALEDPDVETVFLCTPNAQHAAQAAACLEAGKHVQNREFAAAIREGRPPATSAESVLPALEVLQQAQEAYAARMSSGALLS